MAYSFTWIDSHAHPHDEKYFEEGKETSDEIVYQASKEDLGIIAVGTDFSTSRKVVELSLRASGCWAAVGIHPQNIIHENDQATLSEEFSETDFMTLLQSDRVVAIGECGLDFYRLPEDLSLREAVKKMQIELFLAHARFAQDVELPLVIHCRDAYDVLIELVRIRQLEIPHGAVVHCFTGTASQAKELTDMGFHLGFSGIVTYPSAKNVREAVSIIPDEKLLIETDAPYLAPQMHRGEINYSTYLPLIGESIARIRGVDSASIAHLTTRNAAQLFRIPLE